MLTLGAAANSTVPMPNLIRRQSLRTQPGDWDARRDVHCIVGFIYDLYKISLSLRPLQSDWRQTVFYGSSVSWELRGVQRDGRTDV